MGWTLLSRQRISALLVVACSFIILSPIVTSADSVSTQNITMTPSSSQLAAEPGASTSGTFSVINEGDSGYSVVLSVLPYHVEGENYDPHFTQLPGTVDPSGWVHLNTGTTQELLARKLINVDYTLSVPAGTQPGGYYAVIFAETTPSSTPATGVITHNRVGNILYITVKGPVKEAGTVSGASLHKVTFDKTVPIGVKISNTGGVHFLSQTNVSITNLLGKQVYSASLQRYVLPQTERLVTTNWSGKALIGVYKVHRSATIAGITHTLPTTIIILIQPELLVGLLLLVVGFICILARRKSKKTSRISIGKK